MLIPCIYGKEPNKYWLKSQFIVTKYFINVILYPIINWLITVEVIYPNSETVIARALLENIVLIAKANVASNIISGRLAIVCKPKYTNIFIFRSLTFF